MRFLSTPSPKLASASLSHAAAPHAGEISANETAHSRAAASGPREREVGGTETGIKSDRQADARETTRDLWNMKTIEPTVRQIRERE